MTEYLVNRRQRVAEAWQLTDQLVLVGAGRQLPIPGGADQVYPFRPHSEYRYLADLAEPGGVVAYDPQDGWVDFLPTVSEAEQIWEGKQPRPEGAAQPLESLRAWLEQRAGRPIVNLGCAVDGIGPADASDIESLRERLMHARRPKDAVELERIRAAVQATDRGFNTAREFIAPGRSERAIQIELEATFFRNGANRTAYDTIVGSGPNAAVLHFPPSSRSVDAGELVLIDAGAEIDGYAADITRTYGSDGAIPGQGAPGACSPFRVDLYQAVLAVQVECVAACRAGTEFRDLHLKAARGLAAGLVELGILRGDPGGLVEQDVHALFFPHGLGHLVGLGVRDATGYLPGRKRSTRFGLSALRLDLPLESGYLVTIEPGLYFIPPLLTDPSRREKFKDAVNWSRVDDLLDTGGVRIEDNVLITDEEPEVLTSGVPK